MKILKLSITTWVLLQTFAFSHVYAEPRLPGFVQKELSNTNKSQRSRSKISPANCPPGQHHEWKGIPSPTSGYPWKDPNDNLFNNGTAPRQFSANTINQLFAHTFNTEKFKKNCCRAKKAWLFVRGKRIAPNNLFTGNVPNNDRFATMGQGAMYPVGSGGVSSAPYGSALAYAWIYKPVSATNVNSNNRFSYALGDDTQIKQTFLLAASCCLDKEPRRGVLSRRMKASSTQRFMQMMQKDNGQAKRDYKNARQLQKGAVQRQMK